MRTTEELRRLLDEWISKVALGKDNDGRNICPYAKGAFDRQGVEVLVYRGTDPLSLIPGVLKDIKEVLLILDVDGEKDIRQEQIEFNNTNGEFIIMVDHPGEEFIIGGVDTTFKACRLIMVQRSKELKEASEELKKKGYYDKWTEEQLKEVRWWR